jgi:arginase family enzyme
MTSHELDPGPDPLPPGVFVLDETVAFVPAPGARPDAPRFSVESPTALAPVEATAYQVQLLVEFGSGAGLGEVLARYPFEAEASRRFLTRCQQAGLLRPVGDGARPEPPDRVAVSPRFIGAPLHDPASPAAFTVLGLPFDGNTTGSPGARFGPAAVRAASDGVRFTVDPLTGVPVGLHDFASGRGLLQGVTLADAGDVHVSAGEDGPELYARVTDVVRDLLGAGTLPLVIGGDHSLTAPVLSAFDPEPLQIVHLDAHTDLGAVDRSDGTGLHHGNVFSVVLEELPHVREIRQLGLRGVVEATVAAAPARARGVGIDALRERGVEAALEGLDPACRTYVSVDIDVLDPAFAPSTGTPVPGGVFPHELKACLREVGRRLPVVGGDVMEVARPLGPHDPTAPLALEALLTLADAICERMTGLIGARDDER